MRWLHKIWAYLRGYFWLPCPMCGKMFGGHEIGGHLMENWTDGQGVCRHCATEAERRNNAWRTANAASDPLWSSRNENLL